MVRFIISILGFVIASSVFFLYTKPTYDQINVLNADITKYDEALDRANELQALKLGLLSRYNAFNPDDIERLHKLLPDHVDNVRLILDFDNLASKHGLAIQNVTIGRSGGTQSGTGRAPEPEVIGGDNKRYDALTLKFSTQGTYDGFVTFMEDVQASLRVVDLVALTLSPASATPGAEPIYEFDVTIRTYWLKKI